jgi:predicted TPR repeat methyltransferase
MQNINNLKNDNFHFSKEYYSNGVFEQNENIQEHLFKYNANAANVLHLVGGLAYTAGHYSYAIKFIKKAIKRDSTKSDFYHDLGAAYYAAGDLDKAISALQHALYINPGSAETYKNLGRILYSIGNLDRAFDAFHRAAAAETYASEFHYTSNILSEEDYNFKKEVGDSRNTGTQNIPDVDDFLKTGKRLNALGKSNKAIKACLNALAVNPNCAEAYLCLGNIYKMQKELGKAVAAYQIAISINPNLSEAYHNLGATFFDLDRLEEATSAFGCAAFLDPSNFSAKYLLNALTVRTAKKAPAQYIKNLFDQYSINYETHMVKELDYKIPGLLRKELNPIINKGQYFQLVLDLGCGTGLIGIQIRSISKHLIGLDLSPLMISEARKKNLYDKLIVGEITEYLKETHERFDLVVAGDVLNYFGDLKSVFHSVRNRLLHGGYFLFTTESVTGKDYVLSETGRFSHSKAYIFELATMGGFLIKGYLSTKIRKEKVGWTKGDIYLLRYN